MKSAAFGRYVVVLVFFTVTLTGCASFRDDNRKAITSWPLQNSDGKPTINLNVTGKIWVNEKEIPADRVESISTGQWRTQTIKAFIESDVFSQVRLVATSPADLQADVQIEQRRVFSEMLTRVLVFTFGLASFVVPQKETDTFIITASFKNKNGHVIGSSKQNETITTWYQFFFLFAMPFRDSPETTATAVLYDLNRAVLQDVHEKHLLSTAASKQTEIPAQQ